MAKGKPETAAAEEQTAVFVSYSRRDQAFVEHLQPKLQELGLDVWLDRDDIPPSAKWRDEIQDGIERCEALILVLSPDSAKSAEVGKEIDRAGELGKRIVPVLYREVDPANTPAAVAERNWVSWLSEDESTQAVAKIDESLKIDPEWAKEHTRLNGLALIWDRRGRDRNLLIRGSDLDSAEATIVVDRPPDQPQVTELMREFVGESRRIATRRQRRVVMTALGVAIVSIALAVVALLARAEADRQRQEAIVQRDTATSAALAAQAQNRLSTEPDLAALLALESYRTKDTVDALGSLLRVNDTPTTFVERFHVHDAPITAIAHHEPTGVAATSDEDGRVVVWDVAPDGQAEPRDAVIDMGASVESIAFDPTGTELSIATADTPVEVWSVADPPEQVASGSIDSYTALTSEGSLGAGLVELDDGTLGLEVGEAVGEGAVSAPLGTLTWDELDENEIEPTDVSFTADGSIVAVGIGTEIWVMPVDEPEAIESFDIRELEGVGDPDRTALNLESLSFIGDDLRIAFGIDEGYIYVVDLDGEPIAVPSEPLLSSPPRSIASLTATDDDGTEVVLMASAHNNGEVKLWVVDGLDATEFATLKGHDEEGLAVSLTSDGSVMSGSWDGDTILSTAFAQAQIGEPAVAPDEETSHSFDVSDVEFAGPDALVSVGVDQDVKYWDPTSSVPLAEIGGQPPPADGIVSIDSAAGLVAFGGADGAVRVLGTATDAMTELEPNHDGEVTQLAVSGDGSMIATVEGDQTLWIREIGAERVTVAELPDDFHATALAFPNPDVLWVGGVVSPDDGDESLAVRIDTTDGRVVESARHNSDETGHIVTSLAVSPDGTTLVTGGSDRRLFVWDTADLSKETNELTGHFESVSDIVFLDDDILFAGDDDGKILMWDVAAARQVGELTGPADGVTSLSLAPDGDRLAAGGQDDIVWVWDLRVQSWIDGACRLAGRNLTNAEWVRFQLDGDTVAHCPGLSPSDGSAAVYEGLTPEE